MLRLGVLHVTQPAVSVRPATASDDAAISRLLTELGLPTAGVVEWRQGFWVADTGDGIVGLAGVEIYADGALLRSVAVHPSMQGAGLGRILVEKALGTAREAGSKDVYLLTTTAERYFPRFGFTAIPRDAVPLTVQDSVEFRGACPASASAMRFPIGGL